MEGPYVNTTKYVYFSQYEQFQWVTFIRMLLSPSRALQPWKTLSRVFPPRCEIWMRRYYLGHLGWGRYISLATFLHQFGRLSGDSGQLNICQINCRWTCGFRRPPRAGSGGSYRNDRKEFAREFSSAEYKGVRLLTASHQLLVSYLLWCFLVCR